METIIGFLSVIVYVLLMVMSFIMCTLVTLGFLGMCWFVLGSIFDRKGD